MKVIGTGFGRTGTDSMRVALEVLGFGPCHHMRVLLEDPQQKQYWKYSILSGQMDWEILLNGFQSCVDWPTASYWPELVNRYLNAKVLLTWRSSESWWNSMEKTIVPRVKEIIASGQSSPGSITLLDNTLKGGEINKNNCISAYEANVENVKNSIPPERLLIHKLGDGWEPLCRFLDVDIPDIPYPKTNNPEQFKKLATSSVEHSPGLHL